MASTYTLFDYSAQGLVANFNPASFLLGDTVEGYIYSVDIVGDTLRLTARIVPEPSTANALLVGLLGLRVLRAAARFDFTCGKRPPSALLPR